MAPGLVGDMVQMEWKRSDGWRALRADSQLHAAHDGPASLSRPSHSNVVAYILKANRFPAGPDDLAPGLATLKAIKIVKRADHDLGRD
jgi:hypothetical protein